MLKKCSKCSEYKPADKKNFYVDRSRKDGLTCQCKICVCNTQLTSTVYKEYQEKYRTEHKDIWKKYEKNRSQKSKDKKRVYNKWYYAEHRDVILKRNARYSQTLHGKFTEYKSRAQKAGMAFELTLEQFQMFWKKHCTYCGSVINTIGLDRINNSIGYTIDNCVPCCSICNNQKHSLSLEDWICHIEKIYNYYIRRKSENGKQ